jgi:hypothetical protein
VTRLDVPPRPYVEDRVPTVQEQEIQHIRSALSLIAGRLTQNEERIKRSIEEIEAVLARLRRC